MSTPRDTYHLKSFLHFIDVADGQQESIEGGSSWNVAEVEHVHATVKALLEAGFAKSDICVMTGYKAQLKRLGQKAKANGWHDVKRILTIDSSQGSEYKIVIISLVRTGGGRMYINMYPRHERHADLVVAGFLGTRPRANVGTSRQQEVLYFVGRASYWFTPPRHSKAYMHRILARMRDTAPGHRPPFVVSSQRLLSASTPHAETPVVPPPSATPVQTGAITVTELKAQLVEAEKDMAAVLGLLEKGTYLLT